MATIGFIGVGNMGGPMAINLVKAGHQVKVFDLSPELKAKVVAEGAEGVDSPQEAVVNTEFVISMLRRVVVGVGRGFRETGQALERMGMRAQSWC